MLRLNKLIHNHLDLSNVTYTNVITLAFAKHSYDIKPKRTTLKCQCLLVASFQLVRMIRLQLLASLHPWRHGPPPVAQPSPVRTLFKGLPEQRAMTVSSDKCAANGRLSEGVVRCTYPGEIWQSHCAIGSLHASRPAVRRAARDECKGDRPQWWRGDCPPGPRGWSVRLPATSRYLFETQCYIWYNNIINAADVALVISNGEPCSWRARLNRSVRCFTRPSTVHAVSRVTSGCSKWSCRTTCWPSATSCIRRGSCSRTDVVLIDRARRYQRSICSRRMTWRRRSTIGKHRVYTYLYITAVRRSAICSTGLLSTALIVSTTLTSLLEECSRWRGRRWSLMSWLIGRRKEGSERLSVWIGRWTQSAAHGSVPGLRLPCSGHGWNSRLSDGWKQVCSTAMGGHNVRVKVHDVVWFIVGKTARLFIFENEYG